MKSFVVQLLIIAILSSCSSVSKKEQATLIEQKNKELELKEKELVLRQKEIEILKDELNNKPKELSRIYQDVKKSVYLIYVRTDEGDSQGSAFVISPTGLAISNYHVFENASEALAVNVDDQKFMITEILEYDQDKDYILFRIGPVLNNLPYLKISNSMPSIGEECFAVGNPKGLTQTLSKGLISGIRDNGKYIQTTTEITHGSSGGPLFNLNGEVVGITTMGLNEANLNFAINIKELPYNRYLNAQPKFVHSETEQVNKVKSNLKKEEVVDLIRKYYSALQRNEYDKLNYFYAETLKRYFSSFNISKVEAIQKSKSYDDKFGILNKENSIRWNTLELFENDNGNIVTQFIMDYQIERKNKTKPSNFILSIIMEINSNNQIYSIYENILDKK